MDVVAFLARSVNAARVLPVAGLLYRLLVSAWERHMGNVRINCSDHAGLAVVTGSLATVDPHGACVVHDNGEGGARWGGSGWDKG